MDSKCIISSLSTTMVSRDVATPSVSSTKKESLGCALLMGNENFVMSWSLFISTESEPSVRLVDIYIESFIVSTLPSASIRA